MVFLAGIEGQRGDGPPDGSHPADVRLPPGVGDPDAGARAALPVAHLLPLAGLGPRRHVHQDHGRGHLHGARLVAQDGHRAALPGTFELISFVARSLGGKHPD